MNNQFMICINNKSNPASLIVGKVYRRLPDEKADELGMLRIVDEEIAEADGYLYPKNMFAPVELPEVAQRAVLMESTTPYG